MHSSLSNTTYIFVFTMVSSATYIRSFQKNIYEQIMSLAENLFWNYITGFLKFVWNSVLPSKLENWKSALDKHESDCALYMIFFIRNGGGRTRKYGG